MNNEEVIYKPTTDTLNTTLRPTTKPQTSWFLYFTVIIANLTSFTCGIAFGWSSPVLSKLATSNEDNILGRPLQPSEASWIAGLLCCGAIFGPLISGSMADKFGRKKTLLIVSFPMIISFLVLYYARTITCFYIARILIGIGVGSVFTVLPTYVAETSEDHNRGTLGCFMGVFLSSGLLFAYVIGPILTIPNFCLISSFPIVTFVVVFSVWVPESPQFLATANNEEDLTICLSKLRSGSLIQAEITRLTRMGSPEKQTKPSIGDLFTQKSLRRGLTLTIGSLIVQQLAGINPVLAYMETIFNATGSGFSPQLSAIIIAVIQIFATITTSLLVDRLGRRILLIASTIGSGVALVSLGAYFYLKANAFAVDPLFWLPVASLVVYIIMFNFGLGPLPWALMAELFPPNVVSVTSSLASFISFVIAFLITYFFPSLSVILGMAQSFWVFAGVCFVGTLFIYFFLPETKGKSFQEIQQLLEK